MGPQRQLDNMSIQGKTQKYPRQSEYFVKVTSMYLLVLIISNEASFADILQNYLFHKNDKHSTHAGLL